MSQVICAVTIENQTKTVLGPVTGTPQCHAIFLERVQQRFPDLSRFQFQDAEKKPIVDDHSYNASLKAAFAKKLSLFQVSGYAKRVQQAPTQATQIILQDTPANIQPKKIPSSAQKSNEILPAKQPEQTPSKAIQTITSIPSTIPKAVEITENESQVESQIESQVESQIESQVESQIESQLESKENIENKQPETQTDKENISKDNNNNNNNTKVSSKLECLCGASSLRGKRKHNEDTHISEVTEDFAIFAVFDGHDGKQASTFCKDNFVKVFKKQFAQTSDVREALHKTFLKVDSKFQDTFEDSGTTACVAVITQDFKLYVANAGDSRCIASKNSNLIEMSQDHKPNDPEEQKRIENAGHEVETETILVQGHRKQLARIDGILSVSRSIGDFSFKDNLDFDDEPEKQAVTCVPEVKVEQLSAGDFVIVACDGLWDVMSNDKAFELTKEMLCQNTPIEQCAKNLASQAIALDSQDNISVVIAKV